MASSNGCGSRRKDGLVEHLRDEVLDTCGPAQADRRIYLPCATSQGTAYSSKEVHLLSCQQNVAEQCLHMYTAMPQPLRSPFAATLSKIELLSVSLSVG